jgi:NMD protein affecting ribosome stability and mRNA decay
MVMAHEQEHVSNEQAKADREGREVVSQTVSVSMAMCPECGRMYASGGETRTVTKDSADGPENIDGAQAAKE